MTKQHMSNSSPTIRLRTFGLALAGAMLFFFMAWALDFLGWEGTAEKAFVRAGQQRAEAVAAMAATPGKPLAALASAVASQADVLEVTFRSSEGKTLVQQIRPNQGDAPGRIFTVPARFPSGSKATLELRLAEPGMIGGYGRIVWPFAVMAVLFAGLLFLALNRILSTFAWKSSHFLPETSTKPPSPDRLPPRAEILP